MWQKVGDFLVHVDGGSAFRRIGRGDVVARATSGCRQHAGNGNPLPIKDLPDLATAGGVQIIGKGVRRGGPDLDPVIADPRKALDRLLQRIGRHPDRKTGIDPSVECKFHDALPSPLSRPITHRRGLLTAPLLDGPRGLS